MNLSFFTKNFGRSLQLSSSFGKTFAYVRDACKYKDKMYQADIYRKNNTCTSCVFNGFKYILLILSSSLRKRDKMPVKLHILSIFLNSFNKFNKT